MAIPMSKARFPFITVSTMTYLDYGNGGAYVINSGPGDARLSRVDSAHVVGGLGLTLVLVDYFPTAEEARERADSLARQMREYMS